MTRRQFLKLLLAPKLQVGTPPHLKVYLGHRIAKKVKHG